MDNRRRDITAFMIVALLSGCGGGTTGEPLPVDSTVATVSISSSATTVAPGGTVQLTAVPKNAAGTSVTGTASWTSSSQSVATVSTGGLVTGVANGTTTITATVSGKAGTTAITVATVTVTPAAAVDATVNSAFSPQQVDITVGGTVTWRFASVVHNVAFNGGTSGTPTDIANTADASVARTFSVVGSFPYRCTLHAGMTGTVVVH